MISIEGNIGSGKSTLLSKLEESGYKILPESIKSWIKKGWLDDFYENPEKYSFPFQLQVLYSHLSKNPNSDSVIFAERSSYTSHNCFGRLLYEDELITRREFYLMNDYFESFHTLPNKIIYLQTDPEVCLERIKTRGRESEVNITIDYLEKLHLKHQKFLKDNAPDCEIITINGNQTEDKIYKEIFSLIENGLLVN